MNNDRQNLTSSKPIHSEKVQAPVNFAFINHLVNHMNKRNTCYINASPCFSTMEQLWSNFSFCNDLLSPLTSSFLWVMSMLRSSRSPLDPSQFLQFLQGVVTKSGKPNFSTARCSRLSSCIFEEFCVESLHAQHMLMFKLRNWITRNTCFNDSSNENSIQAALNSFLQGETLPGDN